MHKINNEQGAQRLQVKFLKLSGPRPGHFSPVAAESDRVVDPALHTIAAEEKIFDPSVTETPSFGFTANYHLA